MSGLICPHCKSSNVYKAKAYGQPSGVCNDCNRYGPIKEYQNSTPPVAKPSVAKKSKRKKCSVATELFHKLTNHRFNPHWW